MIYNLKTTNADHKLIALGKAVRSQHEKRSTARVIARESAMKQPLRAMTVATNINSPDGALWDHDGPWTILALQAHLTNGQLDVSDEDLQFFDNFEDPRIKVIIVIECAEQFVEDAAATHFGEVLAAAINNRHRIRFGAQSTAPTNYDICYVLVNDRG